MKHTHKREIDGTTWTVNEFSATEGLRILTRLTKLCGGPLSKAMGSIQGGAEGAEVDLSVFSLAVADLASRLDDDGVIDLVKRILANVVVDGSPVGGPSFDRVFQGRYITMFKVVGFVLEVNYKIPLQDFLGAGLGVASD